MMISVAGISRLFSLPLCLAAALSLGGCFAGNLVGGDLPAIAYIVSDKNGSHVRIQMPSESEAAYPR